MSWCFHIIIYCYCSNSRFATGLLMQEEGSCPRSSGGRAMTLRGSQSAGEAQRAAWWWEVRGRWGLEVPGITSTLSASPCTGPRTLLGTTLRTTWTTKMRWLSVIGSRGTTVARVECSVTCPCVTVAVVRREHLTSKTPPLLSQTPSTSPLPTSPTSSPRSSPRPGRRSPWTCPRPVLYSRWEVSRGRVRCLTEPCSPGSTCWWRRPSPASPVLWWPEKTLLWTSDTWDFIILKQLRYHR